MKLRRWPTTYRYNSRGLHLEFKQSELFPRLVAGYLGVYFNLGLNGKKQWN